MDLAYYLRMKFGTSHAEPTPSQLQGIALDIARLHRQGVHLGAEQWFQVVKTHCPSAGQWSYRGADNSDFATLLALALQLSASKNNG